MCPIHFFYVIIIFSSVPSHWVFLTLPVYPSLDTITMPQLDIKSLGRGGQLIYFKLLTVAQNSTSVCCPSVVIIVLSFVSVVGFTCAGNCISTTLSSHLTSLRFYLFVISFTVLLFIQNEGLTFV